MGLHRYAIEDQSQGEERCPSVLLCLGLQRGLKVHGVVSGNRCIFSAWTQNQLVEKEDIVLLTQHLVTAEGGVWLGQDNCVWCWWGLETFLQHGPFRLSQAESHVVYVFPACFSTLINFALFRGNSLVCHF